MPRTRSPALKANHQSDCDKKRYRESFLAMIKEVTAIEVTVTWMAEEDRK